MTGNRHDEYRRILSIVKKMWLAWKIASAADTTSTQCRIKDFVSVEGLAVL
jgi:hypothetical protein